MPARIHGLEQSVHSMPISRRTEFLDLFFNALSSDKQPRLVTVDGRARAGKDTLTAHLSKHADTESFALGVYSRVITWVYLQGNFTDCNDPEFLNMVQELEIDPVTDHNQKLMRVVSSRGKFDALLDIQSSDPLMGLRSSQIDTHITKVSAQPEIVRSLNTILYVKAQYAYENKLPFISQGRDHYTIFPRKDSDIGNWHTRILMVFLGVTDDELRNRVLHAELNKLGDDQVITPQEHARIKAVQDQTLRRDYDDRKRQHGKLLSPAEVHKKVRDGGYDAGIDTTYLTEEEVLLAVACLYLLKHGIIRTL